MMNLRARKYIVCLLYITISISGCNQSSDLNIKKESQLNQNIESFDEDEMPFQISLDTQPLQDDEKTTVTAYIFTELSDWDYEVEVETGKISNRTSNTFDYTCPKNEKENIGVEDTITVRLVNHANGKKYTYSFPISIPPYTEMIDPKEGHS